jgi:replicative DNA helicase
MATVAFRRDKPLPVDIAKKLPSNPDAERYVLGAVLVDETNPNAALAAVREHLWVDDFHVLEHQVIFRHMLGLAVAQAPIETVALIEAIEHGGDLGKLEEAGGIAYLLKIQDGMPRVSNAAHYAKIVKEKSIQRQLAREMYRLHNEAIEGHTSAEDLTRQVAELGKPSAPSENPAVVVGFSSVLQRECSPVEYAIQPLLSSHGTGEIYAWRGTGKSFIGTQMAVDIALGKSMMFGGHRGGGGHWPISRPFRVLYVYGEMDDSTIKERSLAIARICGGQAPTDEQLGTMCKDYQKTWRPKLSTARDRKFIEDRVFGYGYEGLILDNVSTLWPTAQEAQSDRSAVLAEWYTDLNQRGVWVIFHHHAGKSGEQRGDSEKEDMLDFVMKLRRPANYKAEEGLRVEVHIEKNRFKPENGQWLMPFEIHLTRDVNNEPVWITHPAHEAQRRAAFEMFKNDMPAMFVGQEVGVSRATIYRWKKEFDENQNPDFHTEPEE